MKYEKLEEGSERLEVLTSVSSDDSITVYLKNMSQQSYPMNYDTNIVQSGGQFIDLVAS